jgi:hypothetical protein
VNPRNLQTSMMFVGVLQLRTFSTLVSSICTSPCVIHMPMNSMDGCSNAHFSSLRKRLCFISLSSMCLT